MKKFIIGLIQLYQHTLSPDHGIFKAKYPNGFCRFYPSCSEYTKQAVLNFGWFRGVWFGLRRIIRCNPWVEPKVDLIPKI